MKPRDAIGEIKQIKDNFALLELREKLLEHYNEAPIGGAYGSLKSNYKFYIDLIERSLDPIVISDSNPSMTGIKMLTSGEASYLLTLGFAIGAVGINGYFKTLAESKGLELGGGIVQIHGQLAHFNPGRVVQADTKERAWALFASVNHLGKPYYLYDI